VETIELKYGLRMIMEATAVKSSVSIVFPDKVQVGNSAGINQEAIK